MMNHKFIIQYFFILTFSYIYLKYSEPLNTTYTYHLTYLPPKCISEITDSQDRNYKQNLSSSIHYIRFKRLDAEGKLEVLQIAHMTEEHDVGSIWVIFDHYHYFSATNCQSTDLINKKIPNINNKKNCIQQIGAEYGASIDWQLPDAENKLALHERVMALVSSQYQSGRIIHTFCEQKFLGSMKGDMVIISNPTEHQKAIVDQILAAAEKDRTF